MRKKIEVFMVFLLLLIVPVIGWSQENEKRTRLKEEVVVKIKYGKGGGEFGRIDLEDGSSVTPRAFAFDTENNIYIADANNETPRVQVFNSKGQFLRKISFKSNRPYPFVLIDIAVRDGKLYVLLYRENMQVFTLAGKPVRTLNYYKDFDPSNKWSDALSYPSMMEIDSLGNIYLSTQFGSLVKLDAQGKLLQKWPDVDHYIDANSNLFTMKLNWERQEPVVEYASNGNKILEGRCENLFPVPSNLRCLLPDFVDKKGKMYRKYQEKFKDGSIVRVVKYSKQESTLLETDLYGDEAGDYYKVDGDGNIYTIKGDLIKYSTEK